ncbi:LytTR family transcriptional regulator DNA-binding domain-containing protein [Sporosarcina sp. Sa2YVA2]|uniref:LytTR family transcriptional regulator DNA-binding domain-containing protein n=1 Tax=Sporosarcina quadrami TaxID=2762234 RepID=A0ABR8U9L0_9BACL|nr:LytTR family DNA-binding domain-containing protein [Sporosarcina quadrami]MBD7984722.1 LytTR family transcriptional regulator DNA-binding domain-containing protein [Sporosarcina quadrami]
MTMDNIEISKEFLKQYTDLLKDWIPRNASLAIAMDGHYSYYFSGQHDIRLIEGQPIAADSVADRVLKLKRKVELILDQTLSDFPYYGIGYPIEVRGKLGALVVILPPTYEQEKISAVSMLTGKLEHEWFPVPIDKITHIESFQKKTFFYTEDGQYSIANTLKELTTRLPQTFLRIHRSYIVNTTCIERIARDFSSNLVVTLKDGTELPVSQSYVNEVRCALGF